MSELSRTRTLHTPAVFVLGVVLLALLMDRNLGVFDEGLVLTNAMRTLAGDVIHRDYHTPYGPGSDALLAMLFAIFAPSFGVARAYAIFIMAGIVAATFALLVTRIRRTLCYAFTAMCAGWMLASYQYLYPLLPCVLLALIGCGLLLKADPSRRASWRLVAGCCTGAAALFRYDSGFVIMVAQIIAIGAQDWRSGLRAPRQLLRAAAPFVAGISLVFVPFALAYLSSAPLSAFIRDIVDYPLHYYPEMRSTPFPRQKDLLDRPEHVGVYMPFATLLLAALALAATFRRAHRSPPPSAATTESNRRDFDFLLLFATLTALGCYKSAVRVDNPGMLLAIIPAGLVLAVLTDRSWTLGRGGRLFAVLTFIACFVPAGLAAGVTLSRFALDPDRVVAGHLLGLTGARTPVMGDAHCPVPGRINGARFPEHYLAASRYLLRYSRPDEPIFVGLSRHDKLIVNAVALYFVAGRRPGTQWHQFDPGLQTRADVQRSMVADLQRNGVRWIVRDRSFENVREPNGSSRSSGVHLLDEWLDANYRPVALVPPVEIWLDKRVAPPAYVFDPCMPRAVAEAGG